MRIGQAVVLSLFVKGEKMTKEELFDIADQILTMPYKKEDVLYLANYLMENGRQMMLKNAELQIEVAILKEREACADLLMGLHEAQSNNDNHNYYHFASNAIKELRGKTITIKTKQYKPQRTWVGLTELDCVGWFGYDTGLRLWFETNKGDDGAIPLYKDQQQRTWVGLTEEDLKPICDEWHIVYGAWVNDFARDIESKLKEKNT